MRKRGFTLIEFLIVVAIIAILAAIAVPNFLEAQVRAKVSRVNSDHRSLKTALMTYLVDYNRFPGNWQSGVDDPNEWLHYGGWGFGALTSPIAYITNIPEDPFRRGVASDYFNWGKSSGLNLRGFTEELVVFRSYGPDQSAQMMTTARTPGVLTMCHYDPTNGTVSIGDILSWSPDQEVPHELPK